MSKGGKGVEVRGKTIRVYFQFEGKKCREALKSLEPTDANVAYAERMVAQIEHEIRAGTFDYARHFPDSALLTENTLGHFLTLWLSIKKQRVADETYRGYEGVVERYIRPKFGDRQANKIDRVEVETWSSNDMASLSSKTIKHTVAALRQVYALYRSRHPGTVDPTAGVKIALPDDDDPDPFTREEIALIEAADPAGRVQELLLIKFMAWSGPRVSEAIGLAWEDVDLKAGTVHFRRARVRGMYKATKTKRSTRTHELLPPALEALKAQWAITGALPAIEAEVKQRDNRTTRVEKIRPVFLNTNTGRPHYDDHRLRDSFFGPHLVRAGVRYRGPNQCRHTYISQMLTADMPVEWISKQTGTSAEMIRRRYGKWIDDDAADMVTRASKRLGLAIA